VTTQVTTRRFLGSWTLPSGNSVDVWLSADGTLACEWDSPPSPTWSAEDIAHWRGVTFPEIARTVAEATGLHVVGVTV